MNFMADNTISILFVSESWITEQNNNTTAVIKEHGFKIIHKVRNCTEKRRGGGVAIIYRQDLNFQRVFTTHQQSFESVSVKFRDSNGESICCSCIYRTGNLTAQFFSDFDNFIGDIFVNFPNLIICGDVNIHLDQPNLPESSKLNSIVSSYGLNQIISEATHKNGHILDVLITSPRLLDPDSTSISKLDSLAFPTCDHFPLFFTFACPTIPTSQQQKTISFRNIKEVDENLFKEDLLQELSHLEINNDFETCLNSFNSSCTRILDQHAPVLQKTIRPRRSAPWFDGEYRKLRAKRRNAERRWKKSKTEKNRKNFVRIRKQCNKLAAAKKI